MTVLEARILVVCGSGVATSTVVGEKVKEFAQGKGWRVNVVLCRATDVRATVGTFNPDVVLATTAVPSDLGVPTIPALSLLTGMGEEVTFGKLEDALTARG